MKSGNIVFGLCIAFCLKFGALSGLAQTNQYFYTGVVTNVSLDPGTYDIVVYGAAGGGGIQSAGLGAEMEARFTFTNATNLTLLVGGMGSGSLYAGGGGGSFVLNADGTTPLIIAGGGGGSGSTRTFPSGHVVTGGSGLTNSNGGNGFGSSNIGLGAGGTNGNGGLGNIGGGGGGIFSSGGAGYGGVGGGIYNDPSGAGAYGGGFGGGGGGLNTGGPPTSIFYGGGGGGGYSGGGGGGSSGGGAGGGGGSYIDSSAVQIGVQASGVQFGDGEIDIALVPTNYPALGICLVSNLPVVVWPASASNFTLQMTTDLVSGVWVNVSNGIPYIGLQITNPPPNVFFRLSQ